MTTAASGVDPRARIAPGEVALLASVFVVAACGLAYELIAGARGRSFSMFGTIARSAMRAVFECAGVRNVKAGVIAATSQQYPLKMAALGVEAGVQYAKSGKKAAGYTDTGVTLITDKPMTGVESKDTAFGLGACWGK